MENPVQMDDLGVPPFQETSICYLYIIIIIIIIITIIIITYIYI